MREKKICEEKLLIVIINWIFKENFRFNGF